MCFVERGTLGADGDEVSPTRAVQTFGAMASPRLPPNRVGPYCLQLLELMGDMCLGRNYKAINLIEQLYPYEVRCSRVQEGICLSLGVVTQSNGGVHC